MRSIKWAIQLLSGRKGFWCWAISCPKINKIPKSCGENHTLDLCHSDSSLLVSFSTKTKSLTTLRPLFLSPLEGFEWEVAVKLLSQPAHFLFLQRSRTSECGICVSFLSVASTTVPGWGTLLTSPVCHAGRLLDSSSTCTFPWGCPLLIFIIAIPMHPCPAHNSPATVRKMKCKGPFPKQDFQTHQETGAGTITLWSEI